MRTPEDEIPLRHLPLDVLQRLIARRGAEAVASAPRPLNEPAPSEVDRLLASVGLSARTAPVVDLEPPRAELARRLNEGREPARLRAALYRSHVSVGLLQFTGRPTREALERFILEAGQRLHEATGAPPLYLLAPSRIYHQQLTAVYNIYGAAIRGQPLVLTTVFGPLKVVASDLVDRITLV